MDLLNHDCLAFAYPAGDDWSSVEKHWRLSGPEGDVLVPVSGPITMNTSSGLHRAARSGAGIVMMPDALVQEDLQSGRLVALLPDYQLPSRPMHLMYAQDRYRSPKLRSFVEFAMQRWGRPTSTATTRPAQAIKG
jgi:DNA-binding transcriptional LysR family regulator